MGNVVPAKEFQRVQPVDGRQRIQFVQARHNSAVFNIGQPANVNNEVGTSSARCQFLTGTLYIAIGQSESLAGWSQTKTGKQQSPGS